MQGDFGQGVPLMTQPTFYTITDIIRHLALHPLGWTEKNMAEAISTLQADANITITDAALVEIVRILHRAAEAVLPKRHPWCDHLGPPSDQAATFTNIKPGQILYLCDDLEFHCEEAVVLHVTQAGHALITDIHDYEQDE